MRRTVKQSGGLICACPSPSSWNQDALPYGFRSRAGGYGPGFSLLSARFCFLFFLVFLLFFFAHFVGDFPVTAVPTHQAAKLKKAVLCLAEKIRAFIQT